MKKIRLGIATTAALLVLTGCGNSPVTTDSGSGGSSNSTVTTDSGTGYYVDSAVEGVRYTCGANSGVTGQDGAFTFDVGSSCTFYLGDIELRRVAADILKDGGSVVEDDVKKAQLLQTLDVDGNPSNGITISPKVVEAMAISLNANGGDGTLPDTEEELNVLSAELETEVPDYQGHAVTQADAEEHLATTQATVDAGKLKASLAGKTFYHINDQDAIETVVFNSEGTTLQFGTKAAVNITFGAHSIIDKDGEHFIDEITESYVKGHDSYGEFMFYVTEADAQAHLDSQGGTPSTQSLESIIIGKTYYTATEDSYIDGNGTLINNNHVETIVFNTDGKTVTDTWVENGETIVTTLSYSVTENTLTLSGTSPNGYLNLTFNAPVTETETYILFSNHDGRFYKSYTAAQAALDSRGSGTFEDLVGKGYRGQVTMTT